MDASDGLRSLLPELLLLLLMGALLSFNIDLFAIDPYSELFHITAAKESLQAGHFWLPVLNGHEYLIRAPLWTWIVESVFKVLGVSLWAARLPALGCALLALFLTGRLAHTLTESRLAGWFSIAALGTTWGFAHLAPLSTGDILAMDLYLAFLWAFIHWHAAAEKRHSARWETDLFCLLMGVPVGLLVLLKGTASLLALFVIALIYLAINRNMGLLQKLNPIPLLLPALLIPLPWLIGASIGSGNALFILDYLALHPISRFVGMGPWQGLQADPLFYLRTLPVDLLPYVLFTPALLMDDAMIQASARKAVPRRPGTTAGGSWPLWATAWFALGPVLYSLSAFQEPTAMLPFYPPVAILAGAYLARVLTGEAGLGRAYRDTLTLVILSLMSAAVLLSIVIFQVLPPDYVAGFWRLPGQPTVAFLQISDYRIDLPEAFPLWKFWMIPGPFILLVGGLTIFAVQAGRRINLTASAAVTTFILFLLFIKLLCLPTLSRPVPRAFAQEINRRARPGDEILLTSRHAELKRVWFYLDRRAGVPIRFTRTPAEVWKEADKRESEHEQGRIFGVMREKSYFQDLDAFHRDHLRILRFDWVPDANRRSELLKLFAIRLPLFNRMKSGLVAFYSTPSSVGNPEEDMVETEEQRDSKAGKLK